MVQRRTLITAAAAFAAASLPWAIAPTAFAQAANAWPQRPIRLIVPFPPGGSADFLGRLVAESAVVGVPHADFGEVGVAIVIAKAGAVVDADTVLSTLKSSLANFKVPKRCFVVAELPRNAMGKVQKALLREQHKELFKR